MKTKKIVEMAKKKNPGRNVKKAMKSLSKKRGPGISKGYAGEKDLHSTVRKRAESQREAALEALVKSENRFRSLFESSHDAIMTLEPPYWKFTSGNPAALKMFMAKNEADFASHEPWTMSPERQPDGRASNEKAKEMIETAMRDGSNFFEWTHKRLNGEEFPATVLLTRMILAEKTILQATVRDITVHKRAESQRKAALEALQKVHNELESKVQERTAELAQANEMLQADISERKLAESQREAALAALQTAFQENRNLLGELQHRAKNSFAMIFSMISLALNAGVSSETKAALEDLGSRVRSVSELYSLLYSSGSFNLVRLDEYCARIAAPLVGLSGNITLKTEMESITIPVKEAAPIGLILTELMTNAGKYAFPGNRLGTITVALKKTAAGACLEVKDDGVGLPGGFDFSGNAGMGLNLVRALAGQINGSFRMEGGAAGTRCIVEFAAANNGLK